MKGSGFVGTVLVVQDFARQPGSGAMQNPSRNEVSDPQFDPQAFLRTVSIGVTLERFQRGRQIYHQGEPANTVGFVRKGRVKAIVLSDHGKEAILGIFQEGQFFCEGCLGRTKLRPATMVAMEDCLITSITKEVMLSTLGSEPGFSAFFITHLLSRNSRLEEDVLDQLLHSSEKRLARLLLVLANVGEGGDQPAAVTLNQEALADMIGTTRSRVSTFMNRFREKGFIGYDSRSGRIEIHDAQSLAELAS